MRKLTVLLLVLLSSTAYGQFPCEILTKAQIKEHFQLTNQEISMKTSFQPRETCDFKWKSTQKALQRSGAIEFIVDIENRISLTFVRLSGDNPAESFDKSVQMQQGEYREIEDFGDRAIWNERLQQLSTLSGNIILHVSVEYYDDNLGNLTHAISLTDLVVETHRGK